MSSTTLTIASGETESAALHVGGRNTIVIGAPATLPETVTLHTSLDGTTYQEHQSNGIDITIGAGKNVSVHPLTVHSIKLVAGGAVAAARAFTVRRNGA